MLAEQSECSDHVLQGLGGCKYAPSLDGEFSKALLYAIDDTRRHQALQALPIRPELRFDFICSAPSFVVKILGSQSMRRVHVIY